MVDLRTCPKCGAELVLRTGRFGEFWGCEDWPLCDYTQNLPGKTFKDSAAFLRGDTPPRRQCPLGKCDGSGLIPFTNLEGKVIPHTFTYCNCYEEMEADLPPDYRPRDFDFPMSYSCYRSLAQLHGWQTPDPIELAGEVRL